MKKSNKKILVIDDELDLLRLLALNLEKEGYRVFQASTGNQGITLAKKELPDLIILDVVLPDIGGWEVCRRLKEDVSTKDIPIFFLTAKRRVEDEITGISLAACDYITKPFDMEDLKAKIKNFIYPKKKKGRKKILIIEDDASIQYILKVSLEREGYQAILAKDGVEGAQLSLRGNPNLILLDVLLPTIDGWEVCRRIKEDSRTRNIPVIFLTVKRTMKDRLLGASLGAVDYITKPFNIDEVLKSIKRVLS